MIERYDCSGCGDVDTSKKVTATVDGFITGLSGRKIKVRILFEIRAHNALPTTLRN